MVLTEKNLAALCEEVADVHPVSYLDKFMDCY